jgi:hypothetical protein
MIATAAYIGYWFFGVHARRQYLVAIVSKARRDNNRHASCKKQREQKA